MPPLLFKTEVEGLRVNAYLSLLAVALMACWSSVSCAGEPDGSHFGTIMDNDVNNLLYAASGVSMTADEYRSMVGHLLDARPRVLAQNVGRPIRLSTAAAWPLPGINTTITCWPWSGAKRWPMPTGRPPV